MPKAKPKPESNGDVALADAPPSVGLTIRRVRLADLHHDPSNVRRHDPKNLRTISGSLKEFGQVEPLIVQKSTGRVIGGNGRLTALLDMGVEEAYVNELDVDDLTATRLSLTLNRSAETASWDDGGLAALLQSLSEADREVTGFDDGDLAAIISRLEAEAPSDDNEPESAESEELPEKYEILVECDGESHQRETFERLQAEGYRCRVITF